MRIAINGFGRIGRLILKSIFNLGVLADEISVVAIADFCTDADYLAYQIKYDSVHGRFKQEIATSKSSDFDKAADILIINGHKIKCVPAKNDPAKLPWNDLGVEVVIESSGKFTAGDVAARHLQAGAAKVVITAPSSSSVKTIIMGINEGEYDWEKHNIISGASCTAHCAALPIKVLLKEGIGIKKGLITAINSYTASQNIVDGFSEKDRRSGRAAAENIIPSATSAANIVSDILPQLKDRLSGLSFRVPTPDVSVVEFAFYAERDTSIEEVDSRLKKASETYLKGYLSYTSEELVSADFINENSSSVYDSAATLRSNIKDEKRFFRLVFWYDNECGYSNRIVDLLRYLRKESNCVAENIEAA